MSNDRKIRVCFLSPKAYPIFNPDITSVFGGAEVDLYMIATELAKDDEFDVSFIVGDYDQPDEEIRENVRILKSVNFQQNPLTGARKIWAALKKVDANIYMLKTASPGVPLVQHFCRRHNRRFIYRTAHQDECDGTYLRTHRLLGTLFLRALKKADRVFTQNQRDAEMLLQGYGIDSVTVANGHQIPKVDRLEKKWILWIGRTASFKHPERFLELAKAFPDEQFVMICQKATEDTNYQQFCSQAEAIENLTFLRRVPFHEVDTYFEQAKVFVNTSDAEGFPNTFIQACKAATAILSFQVNPDNFLNRHNCGIAC
ncbi:MAG: glycosyltransferase, partial [Planctomycetota bacterium]